MLQRVLNFWAMVETVLDMCRHLFFDQLRARTELFFEDLDEWLARHHLTLPQIAGYFLAVAFGFMAIGVGTDLIGLCAGQWLNVSLARGIIILGTLIGFAGFLPLLVLLNTARGLFDLVVRGGEMALEILSDEENNIPARVRCQLQELRNRRNMTGILQSFYVAFAAMTVSFLCWPNFYGFYGIVVGAIAVSGIVTMRKLCGVKGHGTIRLMMAGCYGFAGGNIVFLIFYAIARPLLLWCCPDAVTDHHALQFSILTGIITALITFFHQLATLRLGSEEKEIKEGDAPIDPFRLQVVGVDETTGKPNKFRIKEKTTKEVNYPGLIMDWGTSPKLWFILVIIAWAVWTFVLGRPNPLTHIEWGYETLLITAAVLMIAAWLFGGRTEVVEIEEVPQSTPQPAAQPAQQGH